MLKRSVVLRKTAELGDNPTGSSNNLDSNDPHKPGCWQRHAEYAVWRPQVSSTYYQGGAETKI